MPEYPFKLRLVRRGSTFWLEELAPSSGGSYFMKDRVKLYGNTLVAAAAETTELTLEGLRGPDAAVPE